MPRYPEERAERVGGELVPRARKRLDQPAVHAPVGAEAARGRIDRAFEQDGGAVVEGMRERRRRLDPLEPLATEIERAEERRRGAHRMERGTDVMEKSRQGQRRGAAAAADRVVRLEHRYRQSLSRERDRRGEAVRPRADDDRVGRHPVR